MSVLTAYEMSGINESRQRLRETSPRDTSPGQSSNPWMLNVVKARFSFKPDPQPTSNDHTSLFQSLVHDLLRRGLLSSAQQAIQRFIASSPTVPDAVSAIEFAAASGVDLGLGISCEILRILVDLGEPLSALDFYHDHLIARGSQIAGNHAIQKHRSSNHRINNIRVRFNTVPGEMCERMLESGIIPDHVLFFVLMKNEPKGLELQLCLLMLQAIAKNGCGLDHSSLSNFDKINSSAGLEQEIELILREITRIDLNLCNVAGSIYVSALCEGGKTEAALACFKNVASAGCIPLLFTFNSLIKRLFQDGRFEDVKSLFEIMQNEGIVPNLETYLIMVNEYCKQEDLASAFGILDQMKEMGPKPNVAIYACIIACLSKQGRISEAETVFHRMHRDGLDHDEVAYMTMIKAYTRNGRGDKALNLFEKMIENAIQPCSYSYTALLSGSKIKADLFLRIAWISGVCGNITVTKKRWHMTNRISKRARDLLFNLLHQKASLPGEDVFTDPAHSP
ncbi:hypothetical protein OIU78_008975 [Salix suchowensis]|nr:hypothetical protein OIU78_008975 [Salix suchowensis]